MLRAPSEVERVSICDGTVIPFRAWIADPPRGSHHLTLCYRRAEGSTLCVGKENDSSTSSPVEGITGGAVSCVAIRCIDHTKLILGLGCASPLSPASIVKIQRVQLGLRDTYRACDP